jgi:D-alanine-D-alanine ligase
VRRRVAVLMGGRSSEHEVSLASGAGVIEAMDPSRYEVLPVLIARSGAWTMEGEPVALAPGTGGRGVLVSLDGRPPRQVDVVFPVLHGPLGEDGTVQGLCEVAGLPCVGAGVAASAVAMDKAMFKDLLRQHGLPTPDSVTVDAGRWAREPEAVREEVAARVGYPAFSKPARLGSSVGISPVPDAEALDEALALALAHDAKALVERHVRGREVEVGVLGNAEPLLVSPVGEITYQSEWYDYDTKYLPDRMRLVVPADLPPATSERVRDLARRAFVAVGCAGMARVDFFVADGDEVLVSELNTIPGFTPTSVYAKLFDAAGVGYPELVARLVDLALEADEERARYRR